MTRSTAQHSVGVAAARNALTLGTSLAATAGMALVVRLFIPRLLGPGPFGELRLAESFAEILFVILTFGVDAQMRRDAAVDDSEARKYLTGLTTLRVGLGILAIIASLGVLRAMGSSDQTGLVFVLVALSQIFLVLNNSFSALEHASGQVGWVARTTVVSKVIWALAAVAALVRWKSAIAIGVVTAVVEGVRVVWFSVRARTRYQMHLRPDVKLAIAAVVTSLPIFVNNVAHTLYARIGTGWLAAVTGPEEVGLYGAASNLSAIALIGMPLLSWVLLPSAAKAAAQSEQDRDQLVVGALRLSMMVGIPLAMASYVWSDLILRLLFGEPFVAAAAVLRVMAPTVGLAYLSTVCAIALIQRGSTWTMAVISLGGVVATVALDAVLIPWGTRSLGVAGGAQGAAWAALGTEVAATMTLAFFCRSAWRDRRLVRTALAFGAGIAAAVVSLRIVPMPGAGPAMMAGFAFVVATVAAGAIDRQDLAFCRQVVGRSPRRVSGTLVAEASS